MVRKKEEKLHNFRGQIDIMSIYPLLFFPYKYYIKKLKVVKFTINNAIIKKIKIF